MNGVHSRAMSMAPYLLRTKNFQTKLRQPLFESATVMDKEAVNGLSRKCRSSSASGASATAAVMGFERNVSEAVKLFCLSVDGGSGFG